MIDFKIPEVGENIKSGNVVKITVKVGESVKKGQTLLELETDKATIEVPSPADGIIKEILIKESQDIKIGQSAFKIEEDPGVPVAKEAPKAAPVETKKPQTKASELPKAQTATPQPAAVAKVTGSTSGKDVAAAPSVRRLAREIGIDISLVTGTGPGGRISADDIKSFSKSMGGQPFAPTAGIISHPLPDFSKFGNTDRQPMNNIRKKTAQHLSYAWNTIPHVTQFDKADITELEKLRKKYSNLKRKLTVSPFLLKVMASALKTFPQFNASINMETNQIIYKKYFNIGVAVDTDRGLLVPIIRDVDKKSIIQLSDELTEMAERARNKKLTLDEMQGGSMTLTNLGGIGGTFFTPIVNWPEVCILGVSRGGFEPVFENGQFIPRFKLPLSLSYDHRLIDGADGARFLRYIAEAIEQPFLMELEG